uniref:Uncharacterized protein n=1 Tax=Anopheles atroparvus TaxID=41427 RepID=A0A182IZN2_ANOAO
MFQKQQQQQQQTKIPRSEHHHDARHTRTLVVRERPSPSSHRAAPQRAYRRKVRQCLWFVLNLYHPNGGPPCDEAIQRRFQHFLHIPVPRTPEEQEAHQRELAAARAKAAEGRRKTTTATVSRIDSAPGQGRRRKVVLVVRKRKPPQAGAREEEAEGRQVATIGTRHEAASGRQNERSI